MHYLCTVTTLEPGAASFYKGLSNQENDDSTRYLLLSAAQILNLSGMVVLLARQYWYCCIVR